ncbi:MAG: hypothetical protein ACLPKW_20175 [Acetobacteraceae bacterium]|jgi:hypothetical protein
MPLRRSVVVIPLIAWLPLLVLSGLGGQILSGHAAVPFLWDVDVHVRFLAAMPLLIAGEVIVHQRMRPLIRPVPERRLISESTLPRFDAAVGALF